MTTICRTILNTFLCIVLRFRVFLYLRVLFCYNMPFPKNQLFLQRYFVDLYTAYCVLFFEENWTSKVKAVLTTVLILN